MPPRRRAAATAVRSSRGAGSRRTRANRSANPSDATPSSSTQDAQASADASGSGQSADLPATEKLAQADIDETLKEFDTLLQTCTWEIVCRSQSLLDRVFTIAFKNAAKQGVLAHLESFANIKPFHVEKREVAETKKSDFRVGIDTKLPPMSDLTDIFEDMARRALNEDITGNEFSLRNFIQHIRGRKLRIATMCSGTESPILALSKIIEATKQLGAEHFEMEHLFSCEIEPFKQAYIERTFNPPVIFRDVFEFTKRNGVATSVYGGDHEVPSEADILVAGFSCKDFSVLNNHQKKIEDRGESGQTLEGVLGYCEMFLPKIVVLENVKTCQWKEVKEAIRDRGYLAEHVLVDTKNYYLPQTRSRGYLLAFLPEGRTTKSMSSDELKPYMERLKAWSNAMRGTFHRPASSPFSAFLLGNNDRRLLAVKQRSSYEAADSKGNGKNVDWTNCKMRHEMERTEKHLGVGRPITLWGKNGVMKVRDHFWVSWAVRQPERILDHVEISFLRKVMQSGFDSNERDRIIESSQNVDRDRDIRQQGIANCVTPTGQPIITTRGGPMVGIECMLMQGLPVEMMKFARETNAQIQDLAGNAMSTTVVGSAILAALMVAADSLSAGPVKVSYADLDTSSHAMPDPKAIANSDQSESSRICLEWTEPPNSDLEKLKTQATLSRQYCPCEGLQIKQDRSFRLCRDCGQMRCGICAGNPVHNYVFLNSSSLERIHPEDFESFLMSTLPAILQLQGLNTSDFQIGKWFSEDGLRPEFEKPMLGKSFRQKSLREQVKAISELEWSGLPSKDDYLEYLNVKEELLLKNVERSQKWTVTYESASIKLELSIVPDLHVTKSNCCSASVSSSSNFEWLLFVKPHRREPLGSNISRILSSPFARLNPDVGILGGKWQFRAIEDRVFDVSFSAKGEWIPSWKQTLGLPDNELVPSRVILSIIKSRTESNRVEQEIKSLEGEYQLLQNCGSAIGSLHKRVTQYGESQIYMLLDYGDLTTPAQDTFVFAKSHHRLQYPRFRPTIAKVDPVWRQSSVPLTGESITTIATPVSWYDSSMSIVSPQLMLRQSSLPKTAKIQLDTASCHKALVSLVRVETLLRKNEYHQWHCGNVYELDIMDQPKALSFMSYLKAHLSIPIGEEWISIPHLDAVQTLDKRCKQCAPLPPSKHHVDDNERDSRKTELAGQKALNEDNSNDDVKKTSEGSDAVKRKVFPIDRYKLELAKWERDMKARPPALTCFLDRSSEPADPSIVQVNANITTLVHRAYASLMDTGVLDKDGLNVASVAWRFAALSRCDEHFDFGPLSLRGNEPTDQDSLIAQPPTFKKSLRIEQLRSLSWMMNLEKTREPFEVMTTEEACVPTLDARLEIKVTVKKRLSGGIVAEEVGYGKTAVILGLIDSTWNPTKQVHSKKSAYVTPATLVLVPTVILEQWVEEIRSFLGWEEKQGDIIVVRRVDHLPSMRSLRRAKCVIIGHNLLDSPTLYKTLSEAVGLKDDAPARPGRAFNEWLRLLTDSTYEQVNQFVPSEVSEHDDDEYDDPHAGKRKRKQDNDKASRILDMKKKHEELTALLHIVHFARIVVDEYTYLDGRSRDIAAYLSSDTKWIVTGTPNISNFAAVNDMAKFLGLPIGFDDDRDGIYKSSGRLDIMAKDKTFYEDFKAYQTHYSIPWHRQRHAQAQLFLDRFARQNKAEIEAIQTEEHFRVINLTIPETFFYSSVFNSLMSRDLSVKQIEEMAKENVLKSVIATILRSSKNALESLIRSCSACPTVDVTIQKLMASKSLETSSNLITLLGLQRKAFGLEKSMVPDKTPQNFATYRECVSTNTYGDQEAMDWLIRLLSLASKDPIAPEKTKKAKETKKAKKDADEAEGEDEEDNGEEDEAAGQAPQGMPKAPADQLKYLSSMIADRTMDFIEQIRALRQFAAINKCLVSEGQKCEACSRGLAGQQAMLISVACGHILCSHCIQASKRAQRVCPCSGCTASVAESSVVATSTYAAAASPSPSATTSQADVEMTDDEPEFRGSKYNEVVGLLTSSPLIREDDKVVIFVQYEPLARSLEESLDDHKIPFVSLGEGDKITKDMAEKLAIFKDPRKGIRACVLRIESSSAAGINLQCANHVIFLSALVKPSAAAYAATMTQAIGRAKRFGQKKIVHIWHILAAHTIDVNVLQQRRQRVMVCLGDGKGKGKAKEEKKVFGLVEVKGDVRGFEGEFAGAAMESSRLELGDLRDD